MRRLGITLILLGLLLISGALFLFCHNRLESERAGKAAGSIRAELLAKMEDSAAEGADPYSDVVWNSGDWEDSPNENDEPGPVPEMPVMTIGGYACIGIIDVPSVGISLPVMASWDYELLSVSPCYYSGSYYTDDLVICGHNYRRHFSPLRWAQIGSEVIFTAVNGTVFNYVISNRETVSPTDIETMVSSTSDWDLTLFTCNLDGLTRCAVRCERFTGSPQNSIIE